MMSPQALTPHTMDQIRFTDGAGYERFMGQWSQLAGDVFLDWLNPPPGLRWLDVGCGNGAFTERLLTRCAPAQVSGIDSSEAQLAYAHARVAAATVDFCSGDAMALPFSDGQFDIAVMPLVIFFVPEPATGVAEMARVVAAGGLVSAYAWDMDGLGFPYATLHDAMRAMGMHVPSPPHPEASRLDALEVLWSRAGLESVATRTITVRRSFADFDDYWATVRAGPSVGPSLMTLPSAELSLLEARMRECLPTDATGRITCDARAHAVQGRAASRDTPPAYAVS